jgi:hypothetical protein
MKAASCTAASCLLSVALAGALGGPAGSDRSKSRPESAPAQAPDAQPQDGGFYDGFEDYSVGSDIVGQGGWEVWHLGGEHSDVSDETAASGSNSLKHRPLSDVVQRFDINEGIHYVSVMTYIPSQNAGVGFVILLNQYGDPSSDNWSAQVQLDPQLGTVESQYDSHTTALITDQWVELRFDIDLDLDLLDISYNGETFAQGLVWSENISGGGITSLACVDLFNNGFGPVYFDDVAVDHVGGLCGPDLDEDGALDLFDQCAFVNLFNAGDHKADFDQDGSLSLGDFLTFVGEFDQGC